MKYIKLLTLIIIFGCAISSTKYLQVADINSSKERLEFAKQISHRILDAQKNNSFYELSSKEATSKMVEGLNEERQRKSYESISGKFGIYQGLEFNQLVKPKDGTL